MRYKDAQGIVYYVAQNGKDANGMPLYSVYCNAPGQAEELPIGAYPTEQDALYMLEEMAKNCGWQRTERQNVIKPIPCVAFRHADISDWMDKLREEMEEVIAEAERIELNENTGALGGDKERLAEELTDVITVCVSWLDALGYDEDERNEWQRLVNEKNRKRGYHEEEQ